MFEETEELKFKVLKEQNKDKNLPHSVFGFHDCIIPPHLQAIDAIHLERVINDNSTNSLSPLYPFVALEARRSAVESYEEHHHKFYPLFVTVGQREIIIEGQKKCEEVALLIGKTKVAEVPSSMPYEFIRVSIPIRSLNNFTLPEFYHSILEKVYNTQPTDLSRLISQGMYIIWCYSDRLPNFVYCYDKKERDVKELKIKRREDLDQLVDNLYWRPTSQDFYPAFITGILRPSEVILDTFQRDISGMDKFFRWLLNKEIQKSLTNSIVELEYPNDSTLSQLPDKTRRVLIQISKNDPYNLIFTPYFLHRALQIIKERVEERLNQIDINRISIGELQQIIEAEALNAVFGGRKINFTKINKIIDKEAFIEA